MKILMVVYDNDSYCSWFPQGLAYLASVARRMRFMMRSGRISLQFKK